MQSKLWKAVALLILLCCVSVTTGKQSQSVDLSNRASAGTVAYDGTELRVFDINGAQFAEPRIRFGRSCLIPVFNHLRMVYELSVPIVIDLNTLPKPLCKSAHVANVTITDIKMQADANQIGSDVAQVGIVHSQGDSPRAELLLLCGSFHKCQQIREGIDKSSRILQVAVKFVAVGRVNGIPIRFGAVSSATPPSLDCSSQWVVFMRRVDHNFSFARNWDEYARGFGSPDSGYYWMGLEALHMATSQGGWNSSCQLRIEAEDKENGTLYWNEWDQFRVNGSQDNYGMNVGQELRNSGEYRFAGLPYHNGMQFSTYDRDNDAWSYSCSRSTTYGGYGNGHGGWWFGSCTYFALTGNPMNAVTLPQGGHTLMKSSAMMLKCL